MVGPEKEAYSVHKALLCFYSDFFRAAFNGSFKEAIESQIELLDVEIQVFEAFQAWLYSKTLLNTEELENPDRQTYLHHAILAKLWILGDKYQIPLLQNNVVDTMHEKVEKDRLTPSVSIALVYENTLPGSCLRRAVIDILAHRSRLDAQDGVCGPQFRQYWTLDASMDMIATIASAWRSKLIPYTSLKAERCHYHVHAEGDRC